MRTVQRRHCCVRKPYNQFHIGLVQLSICRPIYSFTVLNPFALAGATLYTAPEALRSWLEALHTAPEALHTASEGRSR